jgi:rhodanese-related sulfurtransferase
MKDGSLSGVWTSKGLAVLALLVVGGFLLAANRVDAPSQEAACPDVDSSDLHAVDFKQPPAEPYAEAERACWVDWQGARQLAAQGAYWVDVRETGAVRRLRLAGTLAVPRQDVADKAALRGLNVLILGEDVDLRALSRQCVAWRQSGHFGDVHIVLGGVRAWRLAGQPVQPDPRSTATLEPADVVSPAEYRLGMADGRWRVATLGIDPNEALTQAQVAIPTSDVGALDELRQALAQADKNTSAATATASPWVVVTADASSQTRLHALWHQQHRAIPAATHGQAVQAAQAPPLLWLGGGLRAYRGYLGEQHQLAAHAGQTLPRLCGL